VLVFLEILNYFHFKQLKKIKEVLHNFRKKVMDHNKERKKEEFSQLIIKFSKKIKDYKFKYENYRNLGF
jgi:hypothetical protein